MRFGWMWAGCLAAAALVCGAISGCAGDYERQPIESVSVRGERELAVPGRCGGSGRLNVEESSDQVRLILELQGEAKGDCLACVHATLREPIEDRVVIDNETGTAIDITDTCG